MEQAFYNLSLKILKNKIMFENKNTDSTSISTLGEFGLIEHIT